MSSFFLLVCCLKIIIKLSISPHSSSHQGSAGVVRRRWPSPAAAAGHRNNATNHRQPHCRRQPATGAQRIVRQLWRRRWRRLPGWMLWRLRQPMPVQPGLGLPAGQLRPPVPKPQPMQQRMGRCLSCRLSVNIGANRYNIEFKSKKAIAKNSSL
jgi:hypothetical protein